VHFEPIILTIGLPNVVSLWQAEPAALRTRFVFDFHSNDRMHPLFRSNDRTLAGSFPANGLRRL
jgi:hypothetical protein